MKKDIKELVKETFEKETFERYAGSEDLIDKEALEEVFSFLSSLVSDFEKKLSILYPSSAYFLDMKTVLIGKYTSLYEVYLTQLISINKLVDENFSGPLKNLVLRGAIGSAIRSMDRAFEDYVTEEIVTGNVRMTRYEEGDFIEGTLLRSPGKGFSFRNDHPRILLDSATDYLIDDVLNIKEVKEAALDCLNSTSTETSAVVQVLFENCGKYSFGYEKERGYRDRDGFGVWTERLSFLSRFINLSISVVVPTYRGPLLYSSVPKLCIIPKHFSIRGDLATPSSGGWDVNSLLIGFLIGLRLKQGPFIESVYKRINNKQDKTNE